MTCDFEKSPVYGLKPELFWKHFFEITQVPRPSKHEEKIREYLVNFAKSKSLDYTVDKIGNVIIRKPASKGYEDVPGVILQGHMDMVCEKIGDKEFDFMTQPIELVREGNIIRANGTTLGSDNGAGVCAGLAVLDAGGSIVLKQEREVGASEYIGCDNLLDSGDGQAVAGIHGNLDVVALVGVVVVVEFVVAVRVHRRRFHSEACNRDVDV